MLVVVVVVVVVTVLQKNEKLPGIEDPTADPSQWFFSNTMSP
jgi:hypothetical protein